jgi:hypothetical protein
MLCAISGRAMERNLSNSSASLLGDSLLFTIAHTPLEGCEVDRTA